MLIITVRNKLLFHQNNTSSKQHDLEIIYSTFLKETKQLGKSFCSLLIKMTTLVTEMAFEAKTKNPQVAQAKRNFFKINQG